MCLIKKTTPKYMERENASFMDLGGVVSEESIVGNRKFKVEWLFMDWVMTSPIGGAVSGPGGIFP